MAYGRRMGFRAQRGPRRDDDLEMVRQPRGFQEGVGAVVAARCNHCQGIIFGERLQHLAHPGDQETRLQFFAPAQSVQGFTQRRNQFVQVETVKKRVDRVGGSLQTHHRPACEPGGIPILQQIRERSKGSGQVRHKSVVCVDKGAVDVEADRLYEVGLESSAHGSGTGNRIALRNASAVASSGARIQSV